MNTINLSVETTEADLIEPTQVARARLRDLAADPTSDLEALLSAVHDVWATTALAKARWEIVQCLRGFTAEDPETKRARDKALQTLFLAILTRGADDTWSGRKNDARRVAFDAVRQEINDLRYSSLVRA